MRLAVYALLLAGFCFAAETNEAVDRINEASEVFNEIMSTPDRSVPADLLANSHCVVIVPSLKKAGFIIGGKYGKGVILCRGRSGAGWTGPSTVRIEGGSVGLQIGGAEVDVVMLVRNQGALKKLLQSRFTLGGDATVAAGPVGREASALTDAQMHAEILCYSRSQGIFAGLALTGSTLRQDADDNHKIYGKNVTPKQILLGSVPAPASAKKLIAMLNKYSSSRRG